MAFSWQSALLGGMGQTPGPTQAGSALMSQIQQGLGQYGNRAAPQAGGNPYIDPTGFNNWSNQQQSLANQLGAVASGQQQGAGELAVQRQIQQGLAGQQAMAHMARGGMNPAMALRNTAANSAGLAVSGAGQGQQAALQDQANARALQAQVLGQGAGNALQMGTSNAQLGQGQSLANLQAQLQTMGLNDQQIQAYMNNLLGLSGQQTQQQLGQMQQPGLLGSLLSAGGSIIGGLSGLGGGKK